MKVLHVIETPGPGGAEKALVDVALGLSSEFPCMGVEMCPGSWTGTELRRRGIEVVSLPLERSFDLGWPRRFAKLLEGHRIDLVHSHEFTANCYATAGARLAGIPIVCTTHGKNYWPEKLYRRVAYRWVINNASSFVAVSDDLARFMSATLGVDLRRLSVVKNGVDTRVYRRDGDARRRVREELDLSSEDLFIVAVGSLYPVKGHATLLDAFSRVSDAVPSARLMIVGDGPLRSTLETRIGELRLADRARILGRRADVADVLNAADLFVLSSLSEGLPLALLEAMAVGVPVISTRVGGIPEVVRTNETGWLVRSADPQDLAEKLRFALENPGTRQVIAEAGLSQCIVDYSLDRTVMQFTRIYRRALSGLTVAMEEHA